MLGRKFNLEKNIQEIAVNYLSEEKTFLSESYGNAFLLKRKLSLLSFILNTKLLLRLSQIFIGQPSYYFLFYVIYGAAVLLKELSSFNLFRNFN